MKSKAEVDIRREKDLAKYIDELPTCDRFEDRLFFISAIRTLKEDLNHGLLSTENPKELIQQKKKQGYTLKQIHKKCCVPRGELNNPEYKYRVIIGCKYGF